MSRGGSRGNVFPTSISSVPFSNPTLNSNHNPYKLNRSKNTSQQQNQTSSNSNNSSVEISADIFGTSSPTFKQFTSPIFQRSKDLTDSKNESKLHRADSSVNISMGDKSFKRQVSFNPYMPVQSHSLVNSKVIKAGMTQVQVKQQEIRYYKRLYENQLFEDQQKTKSLNKIYQQKQTAIQSVAALTLKLERANQNYQSLLTNNQRMIERLKQDHKKQIMDLNDRTLSRMSNKDQILNEELKKVRQQNIGEIEKLRQNYESQLDKANLQFQALRSQSLGQIEKLNQQHKRNIDQLIIKNANQMQLLLNQKQKQHTQRVVQLEKENRERVISANRTIDETKEELNKLIHLKQKMRNDYENQIMTIKSEFLKESQLSKSDSEQLFSRLQRKNRDQIDHLRAELAKKQHQLKQKEERVRVMQYEIQRWKQRQFEWLKQKEAISNKFEQIKNNKDLSHRQTVEQLKREHAKHIQNVQRQHKNVADNMTKNDEVQRMKLHYQHQLQRATVTLTHQLQEVNKRLLESKNQNFETSVTIKNQHSNELQRVQNYYKNEIANLKRQHQDDYNKWKYDFQAAINDFTNQCHKMERDHQKQLQDIRNSLKKSTEKVNEQKIRQISNLKKQVEQSKTQLTKLNIDLDSANCQITLKKTELINSKAEFDKINSLNVRKVQELEDTIKILKNKQSKSEDQIHQLQIQLLNDKKSYELQMESKINKVQQLHKQILLLQAKQGQKPSDQQLNNLRKRFDQQRQELDKKHYRQMQCLNQKIQMLNQVIHKKQDAIRKEREQHSETIEGLLHNSNKKKQQKMFEMRIEDSAKTSPQGIANEELMARVRDLERQKKIQIDQICSLEGTNKKLREQLISNLNTFDKEKQLYEEINMLKAKLKGYQQYKKLSKIQSETSLNLATSIAHQRDLYDHSYKKQRAKRNNLQEQDQFNVPYFKDSYKRDEDLSNSNFSSIKKSKAEQRQMNLNKDRLLNSYQNRNYNKTSFDDVQKLRSPQRSPQRNSALSGKISPSKSRLNRVLFKTQANQYHTEKKSTFGNYGQKYSAGSSVHSPSSQLNISDEKQRKYYRK